MVPPLVASALADDDTPAQAAALAVADALEDWDRTGTGSPEGVVTAPVGVRYRDTAATNGAVLWVKASGTGNTGWRVVYGDTGNITISPINGWASNLMRLRRVNNDVRLWITRLDSSAATSNTFYTLPVGYRENGLSAGETRHYNVPPEFGEISSIYSTGVLNITTRPGNILRAFTLSFMTSDPWPAA